MPKLHMNDHPVWLEIQSFGLEDQSQSLLAFMVYMELCEDKGWWNMKCHACEELSKVIVSGHPNRNKPRELIYPMSANDTLSPADMQHLLNTVKVPDYQTSGLTLAIVGEDSTTVYYGINEGLVPPEPPDVTEWKKYRREETPALRRHHVNEQTTIHKQHLQQQWPSSLQHGHEQQSSSTDHHGHTTCESHDNNQDKCETPKNDLEIDQKDLDIDQNDLEIDQNDLDINQNDIDT